MGGKSSAPAPPAQTTDYYAQYQAFGGKDSQENYYKANPQLVPAGYGAGSKFPAFELPSFHPPAAATEDYAAQLEGRRQADLKTQGENNRDNLYADYMTAAGSATDYINNEITNERANARLMGVDYKLTDTGKADRISNYFASIWGEGDQTKLEGLFSKWGKPKGFTDFAITRGDGAAYAKPAAKDTTVGVTKGGPIPSTLATLSQEDVLGGSSILGG